MSKAQLNRQLSDAASRGKTAQVRSLLERGAVVTRSALFQASGKGRAEVLQLLLDHRPARLRNSAALSQALHAGINSNRKPVVELLLASGADPNEPRKFTPLMLAAERGRLAIARVLLHAGADSHVATRTGQRAADFAQNGRLRRLLEGWVNVKLPGQFLLGLGGPTPSSLTRFAEHPLYEVQVLTLVQCFLTGDESGAFAALQQQALVEERHEHELQSGRALKRSRAN